MTTREHLLVLLMEECDEVSQRASKALRFGMDEVQPGHLANNADRIIGELIDLIAVVEMIQATGSFPETILSAPLWRKEIEAKKKKVAKFLSYSNDLGIVSDWPPALRET